MNIHNAFLHRDLKEEVYMKMPSGFVTQQVAWNHEEIFFCQRKYALDIISEVGLLGAKSSGFPIEQNHHLALAESVVLVDSEKYQILVGRLIYLTLNRPELSYCVHSLAQFIHQPKEAHWEVALHVVRYLKGSPGQGILLRANCDLRLYGYYDFDWGSCPLTRQSLTGYFVMLGTFPISWKTNKQHIVSRPFVEVEYCSMAITVCELKWLKGLFVLFTLILCCCNVIVKQPYILVQILCFMSEQSTLKLIAILFVMRFNMDIFKSLMFVALSN
ncbi:hypothetical protein CXB51_036063 [Gossypium anomalum]|uniref:Reverse transcriptase Ty1/copia-type domain-containing protein n=1 Tax=Gossypium anomalum TaxID=47600 RepID=A0A8J6CGT9_9ROSI|nr:hypothetical protein CXB51_036063 [Gossypium anomalum]